MVKKSSFLDKLKTRLRQSDVQVTSGARPESRDDRVSPNHLSPNRPSPSGDPVRDAGQRLDAVPVTRESEVVSARKMSQREEATVAVQDGFKELTSLLRGMQHRVEDQGERFVRAADGIAQLPALQQAQLDVLRRVAERLEQQEQHSKTVVQTLGDLPALMGNVREALDRAAATDERTAATLSEFRVNMDRIQGSMSSMVDQSRAQAESTAALSKGSTTAAQQLADSLGQQHTALTREAVDRLEATQRDGARSLRDAQADHSQRLGKLVEDGTRTNRAVLVMLGLVFVALTAIVLLLAAG